MPAAGARARMRRTATVHDVPVVSVLSGGTSRWPVVQKACACGGSCRGCAGKDENTGEEPVLQRTALQRTALQPPVESLLTADAVAQLQRQAGNAAVASLLARRPRQVQRFAVCEPARLSAVDCPSRDPGEKQRARTNTMAFVEVKNLGGRTGAVAAGFDIGSHAVKPSLLTSVFWKPFLDMVRKNGSKWDIIGFSDCAGEDGANLALRQRRADSLKAVIPRDLQAQIVSATPAAVINCVTDNTNAADRTLNRSAALVISQSTVTVTKPMDVTDRLKRKAPRTSGCTPAQIDRMAVAWPLAEKMARNAMSIISYMTKGSPEEALFRLFFGPDAFANRWTIKRRYNNALRGFSSNPVYYCMKKGDPASAPDYYSFTDFVLDRYSNPCDGTVDAMTGAKALATGSPIVLCDRVWADPDNIELAGTMLHEETHALDWTSDEQYCSRTSGCSLSTGDAEGNASSYERFASESYRRWP
jgi:outer membrane protein OmpA-like peptidoglycan-associated protein